MKLIKLIEKIYEPKSLRDKVVESLIVIGVIVALVGLGVLLVWLQI